MIEAERLNSIDDLWTRYLAETDDVAEVQSNLAVLESLVGEMVGLLSNISAKARELSQLVREFPSDLDAELEQLFEQHPAREQLMDARPDGPFAQAVIDACAVIEKESPHEMAVLTAKLEHIAEGKFEAGDLRRLFKCALLVVAAGASLMSVVTSGGLVVLPAAVLIGSGAVGMAASTIIGWNGWDCKKGGPGPEPATA